MFAKYFFIYYWLFICGIYNFLFLPVYLSLFKPLKLLSLSLTTSASDSWAVCCGPVCTGCVTPWASAFHIALFSLWSLVWYSVMWLFLSLCSVRRDAFSELWGSHSTLLRFPLMLLKRPVPFYVNSEGFRSFFFPHLYPESIWWALVGLFQFVRLDLTFLVQRKLWVVCLILFLGLCCVFLEYLLMGCWTFWVKVVFLIEHLCYLTDCLSLLTLIFKLYWTIF